MEEAESLSDRVAIMKDGKLILCDTPENIKKKAETQNFDEAFVRIVKGEVK
jgi:ABC-type multidrug transport system ATPase subunit